jgi:hypothetical protein
MRVPDLDWPANLFTDTAVADERATTESAASLWPVMRDSWTSTAQAAEHPSLAA